MNDSEREDLVSNDEGLYGLHRKSGKSLRKWVRENRALIDSVEENVRTKKKSQHYLVYG